MAGSHLDPEREARAAQRQQQQKSQKMARDIVCALREIERFDQDHFPAPAPHNLSASAYLQEFGNAGMRIDEATLQQALEEHQRSIESGHESGDEGNDEGNEGNDAGNEGNDVGNGEGVEIDEVVNVAASAETQEQSPQLGWEQHYPIVDPHTGYEVPSVRELSKSYARAVYEDVISKHMVETESFLQEEPIESSAKGYEGLIAQFRKATSPAAFGRWIGRSLCFADPNGGPIPLEESPARMFLVPNAEAPTHSLQAVHIDPVPTIEPALVPPVLSSLYNRRRKPVTLYCELGGLRLLNPEMESADGVVTVIRGRDIPLVVSMRDRRQKQLLQLEQHRKEQRCRQETLQREQEQREAEVKRAEKQRLRVERRRKREEKRRRIVEEAATKRRYINKRKRTPRQY